MTATAFKPRPWPGLFSSQQTLEAADQQLGVHTVERPHRRARFFSTVTLSINLKREKASIKSS